jgi:hypothetical protein
MRITVLLMALASLLLSACSNTKNKCGNKVLLLWPDAQGHYALREVELDTLPSPYKVSGPAARIYFEGQFDDSGFHGSEAEPHLTGAGGVCVPQDTASSSALNAYAQYERLYQWEKLLGIAGQISWPRQVGLQTHLMGSPDDIENNAHYYGSMDATAFVPYTLGNLPIGLNFGIVAHELFHAHFQSQVVAAMNRGLQERVSIESRIRLQLPYEPVVDDLSSNDGRTDIGLNNYIVRGWNEGLADFFAYVYTDLPDFFVSSLPARAAERNLTGEPEVFPTAYVLKQKAFNAYRNTDPIRHLTGESYHLGTQLSRLLYHVAAVAGEPLPVFLHRIMERLDTLPARLLPDYTVSVLNFDDIVSQLLAGMTLNPAVCERLSRVVRPETLQRDFSKCSGL